LDHSFKISFSIYSKLSLFISLLILIVVLTGSDSSTNIQTTPIDLNKSSVSNIPYSIRSSMSFAFHKAEIEKQLGKAHITRRMKGYSYEIRNVSDGSHIFIMYMSSSYVSDVWRLTHLLSLDSFSKITIGESTVSDVGKIDPYFMEFNYSDQQKVATSEHKLDDDGVMIISYTHSNNTWVVDSIEHTKQDPSAFAAKLLPEDKELLLEDY
jgi:phage-related protein